MKKNLFYLTAITGVFLFTNFYSFKCNAIPAFARKYQISCQVCHSPVAPRLKAFGDEFAGNGFRMTEYESPRYFINTGDDKLSLFRELPLAIRLDGFATYNFDNQERSDFAAPFVVKILSGGEISDKLTYYFYFLLNERGTIAGVEDAFLMYRDLLGSGINIYAGQFQASDPLFKGELRFTLEPYHIYGVKPGSSSVSLKYERGLMFDRGFNTGTTIIGEIVNGTGLEEAGENFLFDKDKYKNFMLKIAQDIGEYVSVGFFGYTGKELLDDQGFFFTSDIRMYGPDLTIDIDEKLIINFQYLSRSDSKVLDESLIYDDIKTTGGFAEVIYAPKGDMSNWYLTGLFNWVDSDQSSLNYKSATLHAGYLMRRNLRVVGEFTRQMSGIQYNKISAGFVSAF
jgi:hypothetical protein